MVFLARWDEVWRLRAAGLRDHDAGRLDVANERAAVAQRDLTAILSRPRPVNPE